ncbi:MAG: lipopolysaccharide biosynthesis protein [Verrucomicrobiota bacterium]
MSAAESKASFFRQSGWMVIATVLMGGCMMLVHTVTAPPRLLAEQYEVFAAMLKLQLLIAIPAAALQTIFAQQAAAAITEETTRQLRSTVRTVAGGIFALWLVFALGVAAFSAPVMAAFKVTNPLTLHLTVGLALTQLWLSVIRGSLQGRQNFFGLGWTMILDGFVRISALIAVVLVFRGQAAGAMSAAVLGQAIALGFGMYWAKELLVGPGTPFAGQKWLGELLPLMGGSGAVILLSAFDVPFVQATFEAGQTKLYQAGQNIGFALFQFTAPLAMVMFPKIVQSAAKAEKSDALKLTLISTAVMGGLAAIASTLLPWLPLRVLYFKSPDMWQAAPLVAGFAWCMLLLTMANVVVGGLLARKRYAFIPWLMLLAAAYVFTMIQLRPWLPQLDSFEAYRMIVRTMTAFNAAALVLAVWFAWGRKDQPSVPPTDK